LPRTAHPAQVAKAEDAPFLLWSGRARPLSAGKTDLI